MEFKKPQGDPRKTLLIILLGAVMIIVVDLFFLGGKEQIWRKENKMTPEEVSLLQNVHHQYMEEGVHLDGFQSQDNTAYHAKPDDLEVNSYTAPDLITPYDIAQPSKQSVLVSSPAMVQERLVEKEPVLYPHSLPVETVEVREEGLDEKHYVEEQVEEKVTAISTKVEEKIEVNKEASPQPKEVEITSVYKYSEPQGKGLVVIIIDDMGLSSRSRDVENLPGPLTLAYLPYAEGLPGKTAYAKSKGHELMVHVPMEPLNGKLDGGPAVLKVSQDEEKFRKILKDGLSQFEGYVGINNHMGSRLTQDKAAMRIVMEELAHRGVYFIDSKTIGSSVAADVAAERGISYAERDVFLDHEMTPEFVAGALKQLERIAYQKGYAIAIGHPHDVTINALKKWLPGLSEKGLTLAPASAVVKRVQEPLFAVNTSAQKPKSSYVAGGKDEGLAWEDGEARGPEHALEVLPEDVEEKEE